MGPACNIKILACFFLIDNTDKFVRDQTTALSSLLEGNKSGKGTIRAPMFSKKYEHIIQSYFKLERQK